MDKYYTDEARFLLSSRAMIWPFRRRQPVLALAALVLASCGEGAPPAPPGVQLQTGRDLENLFYWNPATWGFTRRSATPGAAPQAPQAPQDLWVLPEGEEQPLLALSA